MGKLRDHREKTGERTCVIIGKYSECFLNVVLINICIKTEAAEDSLCWLRDFRPADFTCGTVTGLQPEEEDYPRVLSPDL